MKLQIDTKAKTIKVDETVKIIDFIKVLKKLLPKEWQDYSLEFSSYIYWYNPIQWTYTNPQPLPWTVTYGMQGELQIYNVEVMN